MDSELTLRHVQWAGLELREGSWRHKDVVHGSVRGQWSCGCEVHPGREQTWRQKRSQTQRWGNEFLMIWWRRVTLRRKQRSGLRRGERQKSCEEHSKGKWYHRKDHVLRLRWLDLIWEGRDKSCWENDTSWNLLAHTCYRDRRNKMASRGEWPSWVLTVEGHYRNCKESI